MLNSVFMRSRREFRIAVWAANSVICKPLEVGVWETEGSSQFDGVIERCGVLDWAGVKFFPA